MLRGIAVIMKIYILPVEDLLQPKQQGFLYPKHNSDYGVEQDFELYLRNNNYLVTERWTDADWHYLPIYWTRWHLQHDYGRLGLDLLQNKVNNIIIDSDKTFTICQYDDGPKVNLGNSIEFLASRKGSVGMDIPLLCNPHHSGFNLRRPFLASFVGRLNTHPIRMEMKESLANHNDIYISEDDLSPKEYANLITKSYVALAPRGYGGSSFRFFEAMQLGVAPALFGEVDTRPFKQFINWDDFSFYSKYPQEFLEQLLGISRSELKKMGKIAKHVYLNKLAYQKWPKLVLAELEKN